MKVTGSATVAAPLPQVWDALQDPAVLVRTIPRCSRMETVGADQYAMTISAGVASVKGTYAGEVRLTDPDPPHSFVLRAKGQGAPGTVDATVRVRLTPDDTAGTRIDYDADAVVGGMIGGVGQRMLSTVARRTAGEFFTAVERALVSPAPDAATQAVPTATSNGTAQAVPPEGTAQAVPTASAAPPATATPPATAPRADVGTVFTPPAPAGRPDRPAPWAMLAAFGTGGAIALTAVTVGYFMGRATRARS
jgi:carbon monoxide dehydrogenase subunit G